MVLEIHKCLLVDGASSSNFFNFHISKIILFTTLEVGPNSSSLFTKVLALLFYKMLE